MFEMMTQEKFLKLLAHHGKGKFANHYDSIRYRKSETSREYCPITFLCLVLKGSDFASSQYPLAAKELGISHHLMNDIVDAADKRGPNRGLRNKMIEILEIK